MCSLTTASVPLARKPPLHLMQNLRNFERLLRLNVAGLTLDCGELVLVARSRAWAEHTLERLAQNLELIRNLVDKLMAVPLGGA